MSETQKLFASISGTIAVHVLLLFMLLLLLMLQRMGPKAYLFSDSVDRRDEPLEVTVDLGELLDEVETERVEPPIPEEPELPPKKEQLPFVVTDANAPEAVAPENAQYESDRNTTAASLLQPDTSRPADYDGPTVRGDFPYPDVTLQNREFVDGEMSGKPTPGQKSITASRLPNFSLTSPRKQAADMSIGKNDPSEGADDSKKRGEADSKLSEEREMARRPSSILGNNVQEATAANSFSDPNGTYSVGGRMEEEEKRESTDKKAEEIGEAADSPKEMTQKSDEADADSGQINSADAGLFADGLSIEEKMSILNGKSQRVGDDAVDAKETPLGKYKKLVWEAVGKEWHRERIKHKDEFTVGILWIQGTVYRDGSVTNLKVIENETTTFAVERSLHAIKIADIPPMPPEVADTYGATGLVNDFRFIIY